GAGPTIAHGLASLGFGRELVGIIKSFQGLELNQHLDTWRDALRHELRTNSAHRLHHRQPKLAESIPDTFPDLPVVNLYLNPVTSASPGFTGQLPSCSRWNPRDPDIYQISRFCSARLGWTGVYLLKKLNSNLWPGVAFKLLSSPCVLYDASLKLFVSQSTKAFLLKTRKPKLGSSPLNLYRVRVSTENFI
ncbi:hypothetical protein B0H12DRAFT_971433, partial [Mycena haematopus]